MQTWRGRGRKQGPPAPKKDFRLDPISSSSTSPPTSGIPRRAHRASEMGKTKSSSSKHSRAQAQQQNGTGHVLPSKLARYLDPEASWDKDQLLDAVHWIRQVLGLVCGLLWGAVPLVGAVWIALFLAASTGIIYWYYAYLLKIDEEEFGGHGALLQEGMFASFTLFLLSWILVYSLAHF